MFFYYSPSPVAYNNFAAGEIQGCSFDLVRFGCGFSEFTSLTVNAMDRWEVSIPHLPDHNF